jgi:hypothetical protein
MKSKLTARLNALDNVLQQFCATRPRIAPSVLHVASWNPYLDMVKSSATLDQSVNTVLGQVAMLPQHMAQWRQETDGYLAKFIPKPQRKGNVNGALSLELATTFFRCDMCTEPIRYPRILMHHCFLVPSGAKSRMARKPARDVTVPREPRPMAVITADTVFPLMSAKFGEGMHPDRAGVSLHKEASTSARKIILACGENPDAITYTGMDQKDFRVECLVCRSTGKGRLVMRWTIAVS